MSVRDVSSRPEGEPADTLAIVVPSPRRHQGNNL
jgi:hypothetical protein